MNFAVRAAWFGQTPLTMQIHKKFPAAPPVTLETAGLSTDGEAYMDMHMREKEAAKSHDLQDRKFLGERG